MSAVQASVIIQPTSSQYPKWGTCSAAFIVLTMTLRMPLICSTRSSPTNADFTGADEGSLACAARSWTAAGVLALTAGLAPLAWASRYRSTSSFSSRLPYLSVMSDIYVTSGRFYRTFPVDGIALMSRLCSRRMRRTAGVMSSLPARSAEALAPGAGLAC